MIYKKVISVISVMLLALLPSACTTKRVYNWDSAHVGHICSITVGVDSLSELGPSPQSEKSPSITSCRLSGQDIEEMPDLSGYRILHLDLSSNRIKGKLDTSRLPRELVTLDISYNRFNGELVIPSDSFPELRVVRCISNEFTMIDLPTTCDSIVASANRLKEIRLNSPASGEFRIVYLNLAHNWNIKQEVCFDPGKIKHVVLFGNEHEILVKAAGADCP